MDHRIIYIERALARLNTGIFLVFMLSVVVSKIYSLHTVPSPAPWIPIEVTIEAQSSLDPKKKKK
jgi:hypothetical protein